MIKNIISPNLFLILFLFLFTQIVHISAQDSIPDSLVNARINSIQSMLQDGKKNANLWWYGWLYGYSAGTAVQGIVYSQSDDLGTRQDMALGAATSFIAAAGQFIMPLNPGKKARILSQMSDSTEEERLKKLAKAEEMLKLIADTEKKGKSWQTHALFGAVNLSSGLITWLGFKRTVWAGLGNFAINTAISEVQIWTQPTRTLKDYQNYCKKYGSEISELRYRAKPTLYFGASTNGIVFKLIF